MQKPYNIIALGGTFDRLHAGHKQFITFAAALSQQLLIGVCSKQLTTYKQYASLIEPLQKRITTMQDFCSSNNLNASVVAINDEYGPTTDDDSIDAIAVTEVTVKGANAINAKREQSHFPVLPVHICSLLKDQYGGIISSSRVRAGDISRSGDVYRDALLTTITISDQARSFLAKQHGSIVDKPKNGHPVYVVGDASLDTFISNNWQYNLGVYDGKTQRQPYVSKQLEGINPDYTVKNLPGEISQALSKSVIDVMPSMKANNMLHIKVDGEEDLATPLLILTLPLESLIYYGQPGKGMVELPVTESLKQEVYSLLS